MAWVVRILYYTDDPDCSSDYAGIEIIQDGEVVQEYGDQYHDRGLAKVEGFFDCLSWVNEKKVEYETVRSSCIDPDTLEREEI